MTDNEQKIIFSKNLNGLVTKSGKTQKEIAGTIGVSPQTFNTWCKAVAIPRMGKVQALADYFHVDKSDLIDDKGHLQGKKRRLSVSIPVYGRVAAGIPLEMITDIIDWEEIPEEMAKGGEFFGLLIKGDSMEPTIHDKDKIVIRKQEDAETGNIVVATVNGDDAVCKRLKKYMSGIALVSDNPRYEPMHFTNEEIINLPVRILGVVKQLIREF